MRKRVWERVRERVQDSNSSKIMTSVVRERVRERVQDFPKVVHFDRKLVNVVNMRGLLARERVWEMVQNLAKSCMLC